MQVTYGKGFEVAPVVPMREMVQTLQDEVSKHPQYEPPTEHVFHGGMYCRQVWRPAGCLIVGKVHKKEHFYMIVSGTITVTTDDGVQTLTGPMLLCSKPGTKRAVYANTDALCMTFHRVDSDTVEAVESELVEDDPTSMFTIGNRVKAPEIEVKS
jgi:quercetin dioxygenase-like cupin family protein